MVRAIARMKTELLEKKLKRCIEILTKLENKKIEFNARINKKIEKIANIGDVYFNKIISEKEIMK